MEIAPSTAENNTVYVVGNDVPTIFPEETDYLAGVPDYEDRYVATAWTNQAPLNTTDVSTFQYTVWLIDKWLRPRSMLFYHTFRQPVITNETPTSITPIPGMGVTAWDQITWNYGSTGLPVIQQNTFWPHTAMITYFGDVKKNNVALMQWREMAGFFDFKTFDYCGGMVGSDGPAGVTPTPATPFPGGSAFPAMVTANTPDVAGTYMVMPPFFNRAAEPGYFYDKAMQRMRVNFKGNNTPIFSHYLVRSSFYTKIHDTYTLQPPLKQEIKFKYSELNRSRFILSPANYIDANGTCQLGPDATAPTASGTVNYTYVPNLSFVYYQVVELRADIHQAFIDMWANTGSAFVTSFYQYSIMTANNIVNSNKLDMLLITQYGNIPYKTFMASTLNYNTANVLPQNTAWPPPTAFCEFAYGDNHISEINATVTHPTARSFVINTKTIIPASDPASVSAALARGVLNPEYWINEKFLRTQGMETPDFGDCDSLTFTDFWEQQQGLAIGYVQTGQVNPSTVYGGHAVYAANTPGIAWNVGCHNQITTMFWAPPGYEDYTKDYGIYRGCVRLIISFNPVPPIPLTLYFVNCYRIAFMMIGNGTCQTNIQVI